MRARRSIWRVKHRAAKKFSNARTLSPGRHAKTLSVCKSRQTSLRSAAFLSSAHREDFHHFSPVGIQAAGNPGPYSNKTIRFPRQDRPQYLFQTTLTGRVCGRAVERRKRLKQDFLPCRSATAGKAPPTVREVCFQRRSVERLRFAFGYHCQGFLTSGA